MLKWFLGIRNLWRKASEGNIVSLRKLRGRWRSSSIRPPLLIVISSSRTEEEGGDAPNKRPKLDCQDIADKVRLICLFILFSSSPNTYSPLWIFLGDLLQPHPRVRRKPRCEEMSRRNTEWLIDIGREIQQQFDGLSKSIRFCDVCTFKVTMAAAILY